MVACSIKLDLNIG